MLSLILFFLYTVSAETISAKTLSDKPIYSRIYLRGLKHLEDERIQADWINRGITYIENAVFAAAKQGQVKYITEPFEGCDAYTRPSEGSPLGIDKELCEKVITGIRALVSQRFPDSAILYNPKTKRYMLKWD